MTTDDPDRCPRCGATPTEPCRLGPGATGDGATSCGDGLTNIADPSAKEPTS